MTEPSTKPTNPRDDARPVPVPAGSEQEPESPFAGAAQVPPSQVPPWELNAAAMFAFAEGKPIEHFTQYGWIESIFSKGNAHLLLECMSEGNHYRPKPQPVSRPWSKREDVPGPVCWFRMGKGEPERLVTMVASDGIRIAGTSCDSAFFRWHELAVGCEHSTDRVTWKPCTVEEQP